MSTTSNDHHPVRPPPHQPVGDRLPRPRTRDEHVQPYGEHGRAAVYQGYDRNRIATHELGGPQGVLRKQPAAADNGGRQRRRASGQRATPSEQATGNGPQPADSGTATQPASDAAPAAQQPAASRSFSRRD
ncbi:hypothetical protein ADK66_07765 [Micromonospora sp. NRRL B-16802]|nr:hypothetical protein ADK66_07765 [Micromonospora sp. NRRL B-16802]